MHEKRATKGKQMGKKRHTKETYICKKRHIKETCKREVSSACRYLTHGNCVVCQKTPNCTKRELQKRPIYTKRGIQKRRVREKCLLLVATSHTETVSCVKRDLYM